MIDSAKYTKKEIVAAILAVEEIVNDEDFSIDLVEEDGEECFSLIDHQEVYLGDIGSDRFSSLGGILDRMGIYHNDYFYTDYEERVDAGEIIPQDDWSQKVIMFLESEYCQDLISAIDVETYKHFTDNYLSLAEGRTYTDFFKLLNAGEYENYVSDDIVFDFVGYLCDKSIAMAILETESAYFWFEHEGKFYLSDYGADDVFASNEEFKAAVLKDIKDERFIQSVGSDVLGPYWTEFDTYAEIVSYENNQVKDDISDLGLYDADGNWKFYLSEAELGYIGLGKEIKEIHKDFNSIISNAQVRADSNNSVSKDKSETEIEME